MSCMHENPEGYQFCTTCGEQLSIGNCTCGFPRFATDIYCGGCGKSTQEASQVAQEVVPVNDSIRFKYSIEDILISTDNLTEQNNQVISQEQITELLRKNNKAK